MVGVANTAAAVEAAVHRVAPGTPPGMVIWNARQWIQVDDKTTSDKQQAA
jgi:hypothetical protein